MTTYSPCGRHVTFSSTSRTLLVPGVIHHPRQTGCGSPHEATNADRAEAFGARATQGKGFAKAQAGTACHPKPDCATAGPYLASEGTPAPAYSEYMARIILFIVAAAVILAVLGMLFWSIFHFLVIAFWIALIGLVGFGLFRIGRWSSSRSGR
jgi:hypothetical protein